MVRTVETRFSRLTLCDDGILEAHPLRREQPCTATLLSETLDSMMELADGQPRPVLWDPAGTLPLQPLGWKAIIQGVQGLFAALAIVLGSEEEHLLGSFPTTMDSLLIPVRVFRTESDARGWQPSSAQQNLEPERSSGERTVSPGAEFCAAESRT